MSLDFDRCFAASKSRDPRFDGRFFVAVLSTRIYCRPICPVPMPKPRNIRFYPSAAAAREAGFRPCLRCRPEASPGTPEWRGPSALVARGLQLIERGAMDQGGIDQLSNQLNVGSRQLRRLFVEHLGAAPLRIAQTRRLHFAKKLIDETDLPMTEVAYAAGFSSVRRFNDVIRKTYARTPTELRGRRRIPSSGNGGALRLTLSYRPPFDWQAMLRYLKARAVPGVEQVEADTYQRTVRIGGQTGVLSAHQDRKPGQLILSVPPNLSAHLLSISARARRLFDLLADPMSILEHFENDPLLGPMVCANPGLRVPGAWDPFEVGVRAILGQQISVKAANTLAGRLALAFGEPLEPARGQGPETLFPEPLRLASADLKSFGMPGKRAEAIRRFARAVQQNPSLTQTPANLEQAIERLTAVPGVGPWTAQYIALRALGEPDAFPAGDLGLRRAAANGGGQVTESRLEELSKPWRPWRAYAAMHLWSGLTAGQNRATRDGR